MTSTYKEIHTRCLNLKDTERAQGAKRFFKTGKGEYGEGDLFYGISVPQSRKIAKEYYDLSLDQIEKLFKSKIHEERLIGIFILNQQYQKAIKLNDTLLQKNLYKKYFAWRSGVNNWDLVDSSAPYISGHYYFHHSTHSFSGDLLKLAKSKVLWDRRIAVLSMFYFIRQNNYKIPLQIIELRLFDDEDLMHKACGWMLREIGKNDKTQLVQFLEKHAATMPRTSLRYSIEKMSDKEKKYFMGLKNN